MARDQVPPEFLARPQRPFEIDAGAGLPGIKCGPRQSFVRDIDREQAGDALGLYRRNREAAAIAGDRGADYDAGCVVRRADGEPAVFTSGDCADGGDDAGEHDDVLNSAGRPTFYPSRSTVPQRIATPRSEEHTSELQSL